jgi:hypothetical protein
VSRERPILFSAPMVRAILAGTKTQTRRVVKPQPTAMQQGWMWVCKKLLAGYCHTDADAMVRLMLPHCPYGEPGDQLWCRETWREWSDAAWHYAADLTILPKQRDRELANFLAQRSPLTWESYRWRPSIHMPRAASRITLEITGVRVEKLQEIGTADCWAEGIASSPDVDPVHEYAELWESINGRGSWHANPFVWVLEFRKLEQA